MGLVFEPLYFNGYELSVSFCDIFLSCNAVLHEVLSEFLFKIKINKNPIFIQVIFFKVWILLCFVNLMLHTLLTSLLCLKPVKILKDHTSLFLLNKQHLGFGHSF